MSVRSCVLSLRGTAARGGTPRGIAADPLPGVTGERCAVLFPGDLNHPTPRGPNPDPADEHDLPMAAIESEDGPLYGRQDLELQEAWGVSAGGRSLQRSRQLAGCRPLGSGEGPRGPAELGGRPSVRGRKGVPPTWYQVHMICSVSRASVRA